MNRRLFAALAVAFPAAAALGYGGWRYFRTRTEHSCKACARPVHDQTRTVATVGAERGVYCCPACAFSDHKQGGAKVTILELTDFEGGAVLDPARASLVRDSEVNLCKRHSGTPPASADKRPLQSHYDRCDPGILAFRDAARARDFAALHGGRVVTIQDLYAQLN